MMRSFVSLVTKSDALCQQVRRYAQVAVASTSTVLESVPDALPWNSALTQFQATQVCIMHV